jgi:hypothetical protein
VRTSMCACTSLCLSSALRDVECVIPPLSPFSFHEPLCVLAAGQAAIHPCRQKLTELFGVCVQPVQVAQILILPSSVWLLIFFLTAHPFMKMLLLFAMLAAASAHVCLLSPQQRGDLNVQDAGDDTCFRHQVTNHRI